MRTTVAINDRLLLAAKMAARRRGYTLGRLIEEELAEPADVRPPEVPVFRGGTGPQPGVDLRSNRALLELVDPPHAVGES